MIRCLDSSMINIFVRRKNGRKKLELCVNIAFNAINRLCRDRTRRKSKLDRQIKNVNAWKKNLWSLLFTSLYREIVPFFCLNRCWNYIDSEMKEKAILNPHLLGFIKAPFFCSSLSARIKKQDRGNEERMERKGVGSER